MHKNNLMLDRKNNRFFGKINGDIGLRHIPFTGIFFLRLRCSVFDMMLIDSVLLKVYSELRHFDR